MKKHLFLAAMALVGLGGTFTSCTPDPTVADRMEGTWLLNDLSMSGNLNIMGQSVPFTLEDSLIRPSSECTLVQESKNTVNSANYLLDVRGLVTIPAFGTFGTDIQDTVAGTWAIKPTDGVVLDSLIITKNDGTIQRFEIISLLESSFRVRGRQTIEDPAAGTTSVTVELGYGR